MSIFAPSLTATAQTSEVSTSQTTASTSYVDLATVQSVTVNVGPSGLLLVGFGAQTGNSGANNSFVAVALSGANTYAANDVDSIDLVNSAAGFISGRTKLFTALTPGSTTVTLKFRVDAGTGTYLRRNIWAVPL